MLHYQHRLFRKPCLQDQFEAAAKVPESLEAELPVPLLEELSEAANSRASRTGRLPGPAYMDKCNSITRSTAGSQDDQAEHSTEPLQYTLSDSNAIEQS